MLSPITHTPPTHTHTTQPFVISHLACISVVVCHATKVPLLFKQAETCPSLRVLIKMGGPITEEEKEQATKTGITIYAMEEVEVSTLFSILSVYSVHSSVYSLYTLYTLQYTLCILSVYSVYSVYSLVHYTTHLSTCTRTLGVVYYQCAISFSGRFVY